MNLKLKIQENLNMAVRERKEIEVSVLRMLNAAILNKEKEKRYELIKRELNLTENDLKEKSNLDEEGIIEVIFSEIKKRREAVLQFEKGKREDLAEKEKTEIEILQKYLPEQLSEDEIKELVKEIIKKIGAKEIKDIGKIMAELTPKIKGRADKGIAGRIVKELLTVS